MQNHIKVMMVSALVITTAFTAEAVSTGEIIGQVTVKETSKPVPYAVVIFENGMDKITVTANEYGYYYGAHLPTGRYQMRVEYNNRIFFMNKVRVYDSYSSEINFTVSNNGSLPVYVELERKEPLLNALQPNDVKLANGSFNQATQSLADVLSLQPGVDVRNGKLYIKGSDQVRFFIDGTPVMAPAVIDRIW